MSPLPGPILLLALPLVAAAITYVLRRLTAVAALVAALTTAGLALLCLRLPLDRTAIVLGQEVAFGRPVIIAGRTLMLDSAGQGWLALVFALAALSYLLAWRLPQGRTFFSFSLTMLGGYALVVLLQTFSLAILVFAMTTAPAVLLIGEQARSVHGGLRYVLVTLLSVPLLLAAAWLVNQAVLSPENGEMARLAILPAALGFGLLLAAFPFGTWMPALAADAPPLVTAWVFTAGQAMAVYLSMAFLANVPWSLDDANAREVLQAVGLVTAVSGGLAAAVQRDWGRVFGYAALSDLGCLLLTFGTGSSQGMTLALLHTTNRSAGIVLMAASIAMLRQAAGTDRFTALTGWARRLPVATAGLLLGGLALAGFPFTSGFPTHWAVARAIASEHSGWAVGLLAAAAGTLIGVVRGLGSMLSPGGSSSPPRQPVVASAILLLLAGLVIALGLYPQLLLGPVSGAVEALSLF